MGRVSKRKVAVAHVNAKPIHSFKVAIYARLSSDQDERKNESIDVQINIAKAHLKELERKEECAFEIVDIYKDLGKTGTNFNRDEFSRMMQAIRLGDVNVVIVKDLSRFGRNYLEAGNYIERIFPFLGVRFIAVSDGLDTGIKGSDTGNMSTEIKNLVNDMYAKDFSVKAKIHLQQRREEGSYVGGPPPYGYQCSWEGKIRKLTIDENTAPIIRFIYEEFCKVKGYQAVTDKLNQRKINPPAVYKKTKEVYFNNQGIYKGWDKGSVVRILQNPIYRGNLIQGKSSIHGKNEDNRVWREKEEWVSKENTHTPIISKELFEQVSQIVGQIQLETKMQSHHHGTNELPIEENIFDDVLYCGVCGRKMTRGSRVKTYQNGEKARIDDYFCLNGKSTKVDLCPNSNRITKARLVDIVLQALQTEFHVFLDKPKKYKEFGNQLMQNAKEGYNKELRKVDYEIANLDKAESLAYIKYRMSEIPQSAYVEVKMRNEDKRMGLVQEREELLACKENLTKVSKQFAKAIQSLVTLKHAKDLQKDLVDTLIKKINLYPGHSVEIEFRFTDDMLKGVK